MKNILKIRAIKRTLLGALCALVMVGPGTSQAALMLTLTAGTGQTVTITDGGTGDMSSETGIVSWMGSLGSWIFNFTAGYSNSPAIGEPATLALTSLNATSYRGGVLTIALAETQLLTPSGPDMTAITSVGGYTSGSVNFTTLFNGSPISTFGPYTGSSSAGPFSGTSTTYVNTTSGFSLSQVAQITHTGQGLTSFGMITTVTEPATLGLLGLGLLGLGLLKRRRVGTKNT